MDHELVKNWDDIDFSKQFALVLNEDSSNLAIPDNSVDAIVTDPPYFDFVHYSELSDFFLSWQRLSNVKRYSNITDSSHENEVQDRDSENFALKLSKVFLDCSRVLKDEGVMCFSFHHSSVDGWSAVYKAIVLGGFCVTQFHPIKAEMSVASPKSLSNSPINIDSILVCKLKQERDKPKSLDECIEYARKIYSEKLDELKKIDRKLSSGDLFVIGASSALQASSKFMLESHEFGEICAIFIAEISITS